MPSFSPELLARWTQGRWTSVPTSELTSFSIDSRALKPGQVFVALKTERRDGHAFVAAAHLLGAAAAIVSQPNLSLALPQLVVRDPLEAFQTIALEHRRTFNRPVVGVTGSAGKTSTKDLLALLLSNREDDVLATEGNLNNHLGVPLTLCRLDAQKHRFAVIEAGISAPNEMSVLARMIEPDAAIVTLVGPAHLENLGSLDGVAREKSCLPKACRAGGIAVFPRQCAEFSAFQELSGKTLVLEPAQVIRPSQPPEDRVFYTVTHRGETTALALAYGTPPPLTFTFGRVSDGMAQNAALAICTALWLGVSKEMIQGRLTLWHPASLRGEWHKANGRLLYLDCYNANPVSMADALGVFRESAPQSMPRLYLIGCMEELGLAAYRYHVELGQSLALRPEDRAVVVGDLAEAVREGAASVGLVGQVDVASSTEKMAMLLGDFRGAVFVKGSRRYKLEQAVSAVVPLEVAHA